MTAILDGWLTCLVCGQHLTQASGAMICPDGHSYDIAKQGYVNLLGHAPPRNADTAAMLDARHRLVQADELALPEIAANPPDRCYHCKRHRFAMLQRLAANDHLGVVVHGENVDDRAAYRPGSRAAEELGVRAPLSSLQGAASLVLGT